MVISKTMSVHTRTHKHTESEAQEDDTETPERERETSCDECGGGLEHSDSRGEIVCTECGLVAESDTIDHGPEWRAFNSQDRGEKRRVGSPQTNTRHDKGLTTDVSWSDHDASGSELSDGQKRRADRLRKWQKRTRTQDGKERTLRTALGEIQRICSAAGISTNIEETAGALMHQVSSDDLLHGRSVEGMSAAVVLLSARMCSSPRRPGEIHRLARINDEKQIGRDLRYISREVGVAAEPASPGDYVSGIVSELSVSNSMEITRSAERILDKTPAETFSGKPASTLAGAAVAAAAELNNEDIAQVELSRAVGKSPSAIRTRKQELVTGDSL